MGERLMRYYKYIQDELGVQGKVKLATASKLPSTLAATAPDSEENLNLIRSAVQEITGKPAPML